LPFESHPNPHTFERFPCLIARSIPVSSYKMKLTELAEALPMQNEANIDREALENLLTRRFFVAPSFEIYGGTK
jgi:hypothetical protein